MDKLLPCPFCNSGGTIIKSVSKKYHGACNNHKCGLYGGLSYWHDTKQQAIYAWNNRAEQQNEALTLDGLKQMVGEPVWCTNFDGSGGRWGIVTVNEYGIGANVDCDTTYWFDLGIKPCIAYKSKPIEKE